ncbi:Iron permease [Rhodovastum atsumiense]|nr:FTR1 family protein [Rhodovastum atsumiense]CAH2602673.1 Iron permease [Rhodovastum atsumiense]
MLASLLPRPLSCPRWPALLLLLGLLAALPAQAQRLDFQALGEQLAARGDALTSRYVPSDGLAASQGFSDLYLDGFERKGLEYQFGALDRRALLEIEAGFGRLISLAAREARPEDVRQAWLALRPQLLAAGQRVAARNATASPLAIAGQTGLILLREGIEALLVITALVTVLRRGGNADKVPAVWGGVMLALLASLGVAALLGMGRNVLGIPRETLEGLTVLSAAAVLAYVSCWLFARRDAARWQGYLTAQVDAAASTGSLLGISAAAFLAVFREGAETVLFVAALSRGTEDWSAVAAGAMAGCIGIGLLYVAMTRLSLKLPVGRLFAGMALLLLVLAFSFVAQGVTSLQVSGGLPSSQLGGMPTMPMAGINLSLEALLGYVALAGGLGVLWILERHRLAPGKADV